MNARGERSRMAILQAVESFWREHGRPPSIMDVGERAGLSKSGVYYLARAMRREGSLNFESRRHCTFRLTTLGMEMLR